jgi:GNAT superfamily N-acetyltransferase
MDIAEVLATVKYDAEILLDDLLVRLSADCPWRDDPRGTCGVRFEVCRSHVRSTSLSFNSALSPGTPFSYADDLVLHHITVRPSYRRQGVGRALMDAVRSTASERGITVFAEPA